MMMGSYESGKKVYCDGFTLSICTSFILGKGSFGYVYQAYKSTAQYTPYAVKVIPLVQKDGKLPSIQSVQKELQLFKSLPTHNNIVSSDSCYLRSQKNCYILMEKCDMSFKSYLQQMGKQVLSERQVLTLAFDMIEGYQHLHSHGYLHLDLKPANILMKDGVFKISDFGLAVAIKKEMEVCKEGSLMYLSMERAKCELPSQKDDIFSMGVILFEALEGHHPYVSQPHDNLCIYIYQLQNTPCRKATKGKSKMFQPHMQVINKMLSKNAEDRPDLAFIYKWAKGLQKLCDRESFQNLSRKSYMFNNTLYYDELSFAQLQNLRQSKQLKSTISDTESSLHMVMLLTNRVVFISFLVKVSMRLSRMTTILEQHDIQRLQELCLVLAYKVVNEILKQKYPYLEKEWKKEAAHSNEISMLWQYLKKGRHDVLDRLKGHQECIQTYSSYKLPQFGERLYHVLKETLKSKEPFLLDEDRNLRDMAFVCKAVEICEKRLQEYSQLEAITLEELNLLETECVQSQRQRIYDTLSRLDISISYEVGSMIQ